MHVRWRSLSSVRLSLTATLTVLAIPRPTAHAQNVDGAITVSATILPPVPTRETRILSFKVTRDGLGQLETTAPIAGAVSQIVMWTVSSSANGFVPVEQAPLRILGAQRRASAVVSSSRERRAAPLRYEVDLGEASGSPPDSSSRCVNVRVEYLIVPAT